MPDRIRKAKRAHPDQKKGVSGARWPSAANARRNATKRHAAFAERRGPRRAEQGRRR